jgi:signal peptidase II
VALAGALAAGVVLADQLSKTWAIRNLTEGPRHVLWTLQLKLTFNSGGAFGLGIGGGAVIVAAAAVVVFLVVHVGRRAPDQPSLVAVALVVGGAVGNLSDRLFRDTDGAVVDFIDLQWWPVFNVADMAIVIGSALLILTVGRSERA